MKISEGGLERKNGEVNEMYDVKNINMEEILKEIENKVSIEILRWMKEKEKKF